MSTSGALDVLGRLRAGRPEPSPYERCEMCAAPVAEQHGHVVDVRSRALMCTCRPCWLLFSREGAHLAYRAVPDRYLALPELPAAVWASLDLPVGTAFLFRNSALDRVVAFYPGPAGATESTLDLGAWDRVVAAAPLLLTLRPDVEALLAHAADASFEAFVVPVDACYELVGTLRRLWRGFDGGEQVRSALTAFFDGVRGRARPA